MCMNVTATVEVNVRQVFSLPVFVLTVNRINIKYAVTLNFGDLNARVSDVTSTFSLSNLLMKPNVGVSLNTITCC